MRYSNRLAKPNHQALAPKFTYEDDENLPPSMIDHGEESSIDSGLSGSMNGGSLNGSSLNGSSLNGSSLNGASIPSALRRGRYSTYPYARSDLDSDANNSLGSSIDSYSSYNQHGYQYGKPRNSPSRNGYKQNYNQYLGNNESHQSNKNYQENNIDSKAVRNSMAPFAADEAVPSHIMLRNGVAIGATGYILSRHTRFSIMFKKKWKELIWVHIKPATIIFFGSKKDCLRWMRKKYLSGDEKKKLIKHSIDFDTMGTLTRDKSSQDPTVISANVATYSMTDVRSKREEVDGSYSHRFAIERLKNSGSNADILFCSTDVMEVKQLRKAIRKCLKKVAASLPKKSSEANETNSEIDAASNNGSEISGTYSKTSNISFDSYGGYSNDDDSQSKKSSRTRKQWRRRR